MNPSTPNHPSALKDTRVPVSPHTLKSVMFNKGDQITITVDPPYYPFPIDQLNSSHVTIGVIRAESFRGGGCE